MALFKSALVTQASGSVGGMTLFHTKGGLAMRARAMPVDPNTALQSQIRAAMTGAVNDWTSVLTIAQRSAWDAYAAAVPVTNKLGDSVNLSGQNMFIRTRVVQAQANTKLALGLTFTLTAPPELNLGDFTTPTVSTLTAAGGIVLDLSASDAWVDEDNSMMLLFQGRPTNASRNFFRGPWRLIGAAVGDSAVAPTTLTVNAAAVTLNGYTLVTDQKTQLIVAVLRADNRLSTRRVVTYDVIQ